MAAQQARDAVVHHQAGEEGEEGEGGQDGRGGGAAVEGPGGGAEGVVANPLNLQGPLNELVAMLQRVLDFLPRERSDGYDSTDSEDER